MNVLRKYIEFKYFIHTYYYVFTNQNLLLLFFKLIIFYRANNWRTNNRYFTVLKQVIRYRLKTN